MMKKRFSHFPCFSYPKNVNNLFFLSAGTKLAFINLNGGLSVFDIATNTTQEIQDNTTFVRKSKQNIGSIVQRTYVISEVLEQPEILSLGQAGLSSNKL